MLIVGFHSIAPGKAQSSGRAPQSDVRNVSVNIDVPARKMPLDAPVGGQERSGPCQHNCIPFEVGATKGSAVKPLLIPENTAHAPVQRPWLVGRTRMSGTIGGVRRVC